MTWTGWNTNVAEPELVSASWIQWLGGGIAALYMTLFTLQQRRINKLEDKTVTHEELGELVERVETQFTTRREAVQGEIKALDKRIDHLREDFQAAERRLTDEIRSSENRLIAAFKTDRRG